jgi:GR25 family glycosyltransferase involved in LPS biosynthesis/glycosyltransferase involved in cell wall biosynthesis
MIVKNEAHIIASTLENLCNYIPFDYWVIVDTGSTDDTKQIICDFFKSKNIKGELHETEWQNFGFNRSDALSKAFDKTDYLLIFDADDRIVGDFILPVEFNKDGYHLKFGDNFSYIRLLLVNNRLRWKFVGVLHEYITCMNQNYNCIIDNIDGNYHLISGKSGARSNNPNKYRDDALILEKAYNDAVEMKDDIMVRYSFYCAQSYKDAGNLVKAIEWYKKRISHGGWNQEVYYSYITIGQLFYSGMNNVESAFYYWALSLNADPDRCEGIYYIIKHCREKGHFQLAYHYYMWVEKNKKCNLLDKLFVTEDIYKYLLDYEFTIIACYVGQHKHAVSSFHTLFKYGNILSTGLKENIVYNLKFYLNFIDCITENLPFFYDYLVFVKQIYLETGNLKKQHIVDVTDKMKDKFAPLSNSSDYSDYFKDVQLHDDGVELDAAMKELLQKYDCYPGQDCYGSDILHTGNKSLFDQLLTAEKMLDCVCFNTLGYFKNKMHVNMMKNLNGCNLYVKKKYLLENKNNCNKIKQNIIKYEKYKNSKKILFYVGYSDLEWNKTVSLTTPMGGSEKALSYLIEKFPKNYDIYVCGDVIEEEYDNIHFVNLSKIKNIVEENEFHTVILSRYIEFIVNYTFKCYKLYIWAHDTCIRSLSEKNNDANEIIKCCIDKIDGCICLTEWHKEYFSKQYTVFENKIFIINNGIELSHFPKPQTKIKNTFVYTSRSERGLQRVLELWESISKNITDAHLSISSYNVFPDPNNKYDFILEHEIKKYSNVDHLGKLNEKELYDLMNKSEFWIYPTNFLETSCITAMEMLKSRVICLYYPIGGLVYTINGNGIQLIRDEEVNQIINLTEDEKQTIIEKGERYANTCSWENRYKEWDTQLFRLDTNNKIKVINLLRRTDRRNSSVENFKRANITNYEFIEAIDGKALTPNYELMSLFKENNFRNRRGVIGCALTHYNLWKKLLESDFEYFIIMEDDFTIVESFKQEIEKIDFEKYDILFMGYHMFSKTLEKVKDIYRNCNENNNINITIGQLQMAYYVGGTHCYSINKNGARKLLDYITKNGIKCAIDGLFKIPDLECFETRPHISFAEWNEGGKTIDSDIQNMCNVYDSIDLSNTADGLLQKYDYYPKQDFF